MTGHLKIVEETSTSFSQEIFNSIVKKDDVFSIRSKIIENEQEFSSDYQKLLKSLFDICFESSIKEYNKKLMLLHISEAMYRDNFVVDHEINFYSCLLQLSNI